MDCACVVGLLTTTSTTSHSVVLVEKELWTMGVVYAGHAISLLIAAERAGSGLKNGGISMLQIIKRHEGHKSIIETVEKGRPQISFNSDGHIVIRIIHEQEKDSLVVLDQDVSLELLSFIRRMQNVNHFDPF